MPLAPIFTPYGWRTTEDLVNVYYGSKRVAENWNDPAYRNRAKWNLANSPFIGDLWKYEDTKKQMADYMRNKGLDWADIEYPTLTFGAGAASRLLMNVDPKTIERLYD